MAFEIFKQTRARTKEYISVTENKTFGLPRTFLNNQGITSKHKAVILYDHDKGQIALHFSLQNPDFGLAVRMPKEASHGGMIAARSFFDLKGIDTAKYSGRYDDFQKVALKSLGIPKDGVAYVITLKERKQKEVDEAAEAVNRTKSEDKSTEGNLDDIPF